jgi:hypothetical protein
LFEDVAIERITDDLAIIVTSVPGAPDDAVRLHVSLPGTMPVVCEAVVLTCTPLNGSGRVRFRQELQLTAASVEELRRACVSA